MRKGGYTKASGDAAHAEGRETTASGFASHGEGRETTASGFASHAEGVKTASRGCAAHSEGSATQADGKDSHAEGCSTTASGYASHAEGVDTTTTGYASHAEGEDTTASGAESHAEGYGTTASGIASHTEGGESVAYAYASHAGGWHTIANSKAQMAIGTYNKVIGGCSLSSNPNAMFIIGKGYSEYTRANCFRVGYNDVWGGTYRSSGTTYAEMFEWEDGNPDHEDRIGRFVTMRKGKIRYAAESDIVLGVTFNNIMSKYSSVILIGKTVMIQDGTLAAGDYVKPVKDGIATKSDRKTCCRAMKIIDSKHVKVFIK